VALFFERYWRRPLVFSNDLAPGETAATGASAGGMRRGQECPRCQIIGKTRGADTNVKKIKSLPEYVRFSSDRYDLLWFIEK